MNIYDWAVKWKIKSDAFADLIRLFGEEYKEPMPKPVCKPERAVQTLVRLDMAERGGVFWRNNTGVATDQRGNLIRFGLCNDSKQLNDRFKSADLVGIAPVLVRPPMVGTVIGQFVARECKAEGWRFTGKARETAQRRWLRLVASLGGDAAFTTGPGKEETI